MSLLFFHIWVLGCTRPLGERGRAGAQGPPASQMWPCLPSEGSVIAYYWSEFSIPSHLVEDSERAMAQERAVKLPPRTRTLHSFVLTSVVAFRECRATRGGQAGGPRQGNCCQHAGRGDSVLAGPSLSRIRKQEQGNRPNQ